MPLIDIGSQKQLLLDDYIVESLTDTRRALNPAEKVEDNPVLESKLPWEERDLTLIGIAFDPADGRGSINFEGDFRHAKYAIGQRAYALHHVRLTYQLPTPMAAEIQVAGWCRNLTDQKYKTYAADLSSFQKTTLNFVGDPRSCGADMSFTW